MSTTAVAASQAWLDQYLRGEVEGPEWEVVQSEDLLFGMVARVEAQEPTWLERRLSDSDLDWALRADVYRCLTTSLRHRLRSTFGVTP